jgi:O-antigen ligase
MRYLLAFFFFAMYAGDQLGLDISLGPGLSFKNLLLYSMLVGIALNAAVARNRAFELPSVLVPFGLLILYALITWIAVAFVLSNPDYQMKESFIRLKSSLVDQYLTLLVFFYGVMHAKDTFWLLRTIIWIAILGNVVTLIDTFNVPNLGLVDARARDSRFLGFVGEANEYGKFLVLVLPGCVALYVTTTRKVRLLAGIGILTTAIALVLTGSRGAYAGLVAGSIFAAFFLRRIISTQMLVRAGFIAVSIFAFVMAISMMSGYTDVLLERFSRFEGSSHLATSGRSTIWRNAIEAMIENPLSFLTGYGFSSYESSTRFYAATHNMYLNYLYNLGSIGLILFVSIFGQILGAARSVVTYATAGDRPYFVALVFGLFSFLVSLLFSEYHASGYLLWAYLGVAMRMAMDVRSSNAFEMGEDTSHFSAGSPQKGKSQVASAELDTPTLTKHNM